MVVASTAIDAVRVGSSEAAAIYLGADSVWTANAPGMVLINPTSIAYSGTSASIGANGQVTFTAVTSLSLNGVFSADFDNYVVSVRGSIATSGAGVRIRYRASGTDDSGTNYTQQYLEAEGTSVTSSRATSENKGGVAGFNNAYPQGFSLNIYGPYLSQPTAWRSIDINAYLGAAISEYAGTHSLSTSYDGFTLIPDANSITGALQVMGVRS